MKGKTIGQRVAIQQKQDHAYRLILTGLEMLVELDPPKTSNAGKLLGRMAKAADLYERVRFPLKDWPK